MPIAVQQGKKDHGTLNGLADDDHTQYILATGARTGASSQAQVFTNGVTSTGVLTVGQLVRPDGDATDAIKFQNAAGSSDVITVDTTNNKILMKGTTSSKLLYISRSDTETLIESSNSSSGSGNALKLQSRFQDGNPGVTYLNIDRISMPRFTFFTNPTTTTGKYTKFDFSSTASSGTATFFSFEPNVNQSGTAGYIGFEINVTETATGSGTKTLMSVGKGGTAYFTISSTGAITSSSGATHGFYGAAAAAKQTITGSRAGNAALADLLTKLATLGLITDSTSA